MFNIKNIMAYNCIYLKNVFIFILIIVIIIIILLILILYIIIIRINQCILILN